MNELLSDGAKALILKEIRAVISPLGAWTKGVEAKSPTRVGVSPRAGDANCWCLMGASRKVAPGIGDLVESLLYDIVSPTYNRGGFYASVANWNDVDYRRHSHVLSKLDEGIKKFDPSYVPPKVSAWTRFQSWYSKGW